MEKAGKAAGGEGARPGSTSTGAQGRELGRVCGCGVGNERLVSLWEEQGAGGIYGCLQMQTPDEPRRSRNTRRNCSKMGRKEQGFKRESSELRTADYFCPRSRGGWRAGDFSGFRNPPGQRRRAVGAHRQPWELGPTTPRATAEALRSSLSTSPLEFPSKTKHKTPPACTVETCHFHRCCGTERAGWWGGRLRSRG